MSTRLDEQLRLYGTYLDSLLVEVEPQQIMDRAANPVDRSLPDEVTVPTWRRGLVVAFGAAAVVLALIGAVLLVVRPLGGEEVPPATTEPSVVTTTVPQTAIPAGESAGLLNDANDLVFAPDGSLWAATSGGLVHWDVATGEYVIFTADHGVPADGVETVGVAPDGTVWTAGNGWIASYDDSWQVFSSANVPELDGGFDGPVVDGDGVVWVLVGGEDLLRFDGSWSTVYSPGPGELSAARGLNNLNVGPDGTLWGAAFDRGVLAFDGTTWHRYTEDDGAPERSTGIAVAPNGDVWAWGGGYYTAPEGGDYIPPTGFARFDGSTWTTYTTEDGLLANGGSVVIAPDGTVWVVHGELGPDHEPVRTTLSRFDGATWTTYPDLDLFGAGGSSEAVAISDSAFWMSSSSGIVGFDGTATTLLAVPLDLATPPLLAKAMTPSTEQDPIRISTVLGDLEFATMQLPLGVEFWRTETTPYGLIAVAIDGSALYWSTDAVTWEGIRTDVDPWWITTDREDVILYGDGFARFAWDGSGWIEVSNVDLPGNVTDVAFGPNATVALVGDTIYYSNDGVTFAPAESGPSRERLATAGAGRCENIRGPMSSGGAGDKIGPILATEAGFVIYSPRILRTGTARPGVSRSLWASTDGNTWDLVSTDSPFGQGAAVQDIAAYEGHYVAVGGITDPEEGAVWVSDDGVNWQRADVDIDGGVTVAAGDLGWFVTNDGVDMWFSADGVNWDGPYEGPEALFGFYFRTEPVVGTDMIVSVGGGHDTYVVGRLVE